METRILCPIGNSIEFLDLFDRIEALRYYLEKQVGADQFYEAYKFVQSPPTESDNNSELVKILGKNNIKFVPLIYQLIVCEDNYYGS